VSRSWRVATAIALIATSAGALQFDRQNPSYRTDVAYDGRFTFVRLRWQSDFGGSSGGASSSAWNHDYPAPRATGR
jgi:hypothetical protein